ncbi:MAG: class I SAM-dependent methyltransferase [Bacteroidaceae bacterium]|jgi:SAM-dependent methyltransferase|nr:class I SAM-dependent methyltransferase [Bacteroidaceae bacterium]MBR5847323.1 class I SAM-dependent methyltransferase [Bacteroidaceae bacterium]
MSLIPPHKDPMGTAIAEYHRTGRAGTLRVFSSQFDEDEIPVEQLFRTLDEMPAIEQRALAMARGKILDVGAGSGCHALAMQAMGKEVTAIDISELSVEVMRQRGVVDARALDLYDEHFVERFDTILLLMNGSGIIGNMEGMERFFYRMKQLLKPGGRIYMDSSDLKYLFEEEDGSYLIDVAGEYYGLVDFQMQYKQVKGESFDWLYIDFDTLAYYAEQYGFTAEVVCQGEHYDYLAVMTMNG